MGLNTIIRLGTRANMHTLRHKCRKLNMSEDNTWGEKKRVRGWSSGFGGVLEGNEARHHWR